MLVVKHLYNWSYEQVEQWVSDSLVLRQFCRVYVARVPDDTTLMRWANLIQPVTLQQLLDHVVDLARQHHVTRGRKLRLDSTVVATNIHYPVDSTLLADGVRVLTRTIQRAKPILHETVERARTLFRNRTRSVRRVTKQLIDAARRRSEQATQDVQDYYQQLLDLTQQVVAQAEQVQQHLLTQLQQQTDRTAQRLAETLQTFVPRVKQVIDQTTRRVREGEAVPAGEKVVSIFEPHTAIIRKGKAGKPTEFGRVLWLAETEGGIITQARVLNGNPDDAAQFVPSLDVHCAQFGRPPKLVAGDGKLATATNEQAAQQCGITRVVLPRPGRKTPTRLAHERQRWFRRGRNWRAGIEGRISGLKRRHGLDRCGYHDDEGMERWVGWGVIAHDLRMIAQHQVEQSARQE
jgi:IS5 family transposase